MPRLIVATNQNGTEQRVQTDLSVTQAVEILRGSDNRFGQSLVADYDRWSHQGGLKGNKAAWALVLAQQTVDRAQKSVTPRENVTITEDFAGLSAILRHAVTGGKKFPKIALRTADGKPIMLSLAGDRSKTPGSVQVTDGGKYGDNVWYGRIEPTGAWVGGRDADADVLELLRAFAADPQSVAAAYGRETGECCFCQADLTDERSVLQGYGPICADKYGLPWGERPAKRPLAGVQRYLPQPDQARSLPDQGYHGLKAEFATAELANERAGFASDPDYSAFVASGAPSRPFGLEDLLEAAAASATRDGYLPLARERVFAGCGDADPWRDDD